MNVFSVLGLNYEMFHSRMLKWLWTPDADHEAGSAYLRSLLDALEISSGLEVQVDAEVKLHAQRGAKWRLADIVIRTADALILIENKVDPGYQDLNQILDEIGGGRQIAVEEGRTFKFALIAPGPVSKQIRDAIESCDGRFLSWGKLVELLGNVSVSNMEATTAEFIRQYLEFCRANNTPGSKSTGQPDNTLLADAAEGIRAMIEEHPPEATMTATDLWPQFQERYPDHAAALDDRWADAKHYGAKSWFAAKLQSMSQSGGLIQDTGEWHQVPTEWGFPKVRVYRRITDQ